MAIKLKKSQLELFFTVLRDTQGVLSLQDARIRDAFMKPLGVATDTFYEERKAIYEKFCDKNEDGTPDTTEDKFKFKKEVEVELTSELQTLMDEEAEVEYVWGVTGDKLKEFIEKSTYAPKYGETQIIDEIMTLTI